LSGFERVTVRIGGAEVALRAVREDDAAALLEFLRRESATTEQVLTQPDEFPQNLEEEREVIRNHNKLGGILMLAARGEEIAGVLSARPGNRRRSAHSAEFGITVARAWQCKGLGTEMIRALLAWATRHPTLEKVCLQVFATNPRARALYQRLGFVEEGRQAGQAKFGPGRYADNIHMGVWVKPRPGA
jgi:RimJ/RimL family protein N-acetyltransferase